MQPLPWLINTIIGFIQCHEVPGKYSLYRATKDKYGRKLISYTIAGAKFLIPWDQWCFWKNFGPENYYLEEIIPFTKVLNEELGSFDFYDLGADVGVVSALVNKYCPRLNKIFAFEPNPASFELLQQNISNIHACHQSYNMAVSDFSGRCHFTYNDKQGSDHEGHLALAKKGETKVIALDHFVAENGMEINKNIAVKIDVEGQELAALNGAKQLLQSAKKVVVLLELHPDVLRRDKQTPEDLFNAAETIRQFKWILPLNNNCLLDRTTKFYHQFPLQQYDVIGIAG